MAPFLFVWRYDMNNNDRYWVWLQRAAGKGANLERLLAPFGGDVRALYEASPAEREELLRGRGMKETPWHEEDLREQGVRGGRAAEPQVRMEGWDGENGSPRKKRRPVSPNTLAKMQKVSLAEADEVLEECAARGIAVLTPEDACYPPLLREIPTRPAVLYALGDVSLFTPAALPFAMVGARDARLTSLCAASALAETLARAGLLVVSGGAIGTDSACHIGALNAGRPTVAVLGTGIGTNYLQQNADLRRVISKNGVLLTEMEPGEPGSLGSFPLRNRIIAGMSIGTLVVEAAVKSGSLITSRYAEEYSRDIFVPLFPGVDPTGALGERFESYCEGADLPSADLPGKRRQPLS
ncbi:MAG: DNA-protecting protein DprA, partial [Clostridia bacterium]|nr:DNA-protecting protein DprA [Clostridia bacterium]